MYLCTLLYMLNKWRPVATLNLLEGLVDLVVLTRQMLYVSRWKDAEEISRVI